MTYLFLFFFSSRRRHTRCSRDWSSDVCSSDLVTNALDQARREIETRYDLKGTKNEVTLDKTDIVLVSPDDMKLKAVTDILQSKLHKRGIPLKGLTYGTVETASGGVLKQKIALQQGIPMDKA